MTTDLATARLIADMISPDSGAIDVFGQSALPDDQTLVNALRQNKVPLLSLNTNVPRWHAFYWGQAFRHARSEEEILWATIRSEFLAVHEAMENAGIRDVCIKSVGLAPALPYRSDNLDILVPLSEGQRARQLLRDLGYVELLNVEEPHKFLFRKFRGGTTVSAIHLHEFVGWGTGFMDDQGVIERARPSRDDPAARIPSTEDALLITMAHAFYEDKEIALGDIWKVRHLLQERDLDWDLICRMTEQRGWLEGLWSCVSLWSRLESLLYSTCSFPKEIIHKSTDMPFFCRAYLKRDEHRTATFPYLISFRFSKRHYYRKVRQDTILTGRQKAIDAMRHTWAGIARRLPIKPQRPMLVTLSGIDGSGKTVQAETLCRAFSECAIAARRVWSRGGSSGLTDIITRLVKPFLPEQHRLDTVSDTRQAKLERKKAWLRRPLLRAGWLCLVAADLILQYGRRVAWPLLLGQVVIADRYIYDAFVELAVLTDQQPLAEYWLARPLHALCPHPRLAYLLDVSPETAWHRKPDEVLDDLERQQFMYMRMARAWGLHIVDANCDLIKIQDEVVYEVLTTYYDYWHRSWRGPICES